MNALPSQSRFTAGSPYAAVFGDRREDALAQGDDPQIILDLSRLLSRALHATPTGVDRVEMAYAQTLLRLAPERLSFSLTHPCGLHGQVDKAAAAAFIAATAKRWEQGCASPRWATAARACARLIPAPGRRRGGSAPAAYIHTSARSLERIGMLRSSLSAWRARFIPFVHDLIPLEYPEYARPQGRELYRRKLETVAALADGVVVNSHATAAGLAPILRRAGRRIPIHVAHLGASDRPNFATAPMISTPYFMVLGTIEPRKNHLLLLHVWRRLAGRLGSAAPHLLIVGRRGWENEMVLDLLDRCPALQGLVHERQDLSDAEARRAMHGALAILLPSFAEGYGLPVVEALALGVPVIASDLPALREAGGGAPDYLDPLDAAAWERAILDYAAPNSGRRALQLARLRSWTKPSWESHVRSAMNFVREICR